MGGGDKPLLELAGRPILVHVLDQLRDQATNIAINANGDPLRFSQFGISVIPDPVAGLPGPLAGILAGMEWAAGFGASNVLTIAGDTPFFPAILAQRLAAAGDSQTIAVAASAGRLHPTFALWPTSLAAELRAFFAVGETYRVTAFIERHPAIGVDFPLAQAQGEAFDPFFNINTPQDLAFAERLLKRGSA